jgi:hypothetical protein
MISIVKNSNKFQKTRFWKEKLVEDVVTLGPMAQATLVRIEFTLININISNYKLHICNYYCLIAKSRVFKL